jgi:hypothetical protein
MPAKLQTVQGATEQTVLTWGRPQDGSMVDGIL